MTAADNVANAATPTTTTAGPACPSAPTSNGADAEASGDGDRDVQRIGDEATEFDCDDVLVEAEIRDSVRGTAETSATGYASAGSEHISMLLVLLLLLCRLCRTESAAAVCWCSGSDSAIVAATAAATSSGSVLLADKIAAGSSPMDSTDAGEAASVFGWVASSFWICVSFGGGRVAMAMRVLWMSAKTCRRGDWFSRVFVGCMS